MKNQGGCICGSIRYQLSDDPLFIQACHCTHCQRSTGSAFMLTIVLEAEKLELLSGEPSRYDFSGGSGLHYDLNYCGHCGTPVWGSIHNQPKGIAFIRAGTLDDTSDVKPAAHIYTGSKQDWVILGDDVPQFEEIYQREQLWPKASLERIQKLA